MSIARQSGATPAEPAGGLTDGDIHARIIASILDHRLQPGTKLVEDKLGQAFGVSRTRIRQVLIRLANERIVTLTPNRGASVARPDPQEAAEVFDVRRLVEPPLLEAFIERASRGQFDELGELIELEVAARARHDRHAAIRLTGEFHLRIAQGSGHQTLTRILVELVSRTSLILMSYPQQGDPRGTDHSACRCDEHRAMLAALRLGDARAATRLMKSHLNALQRQIDFDAVPTGGQDLIELFSSR